jgi:hypothetical protein
MYLNISDRFKCIFIHIPRTAGTSIKGALEMQGRGHPLWQYYYLVYPEQWDSYFKFTVVRNPWDRMVSAYHYAKMEKSYWHDNLNRISPHPDYELLSKKTFEETCAILKNRRTLLQHEVWHPQYLFVTKQENKIHSIAVDFVLRHENIEKDFKALCEKLQIKDIPLPCVNPSTHDNYRSYYTDETKGLIGKAYSTDIRLFEYEF